MANNFVLNFDANIQGLVSKVDAIIAKFQQMGAELKAMGKGSVFLDLFAGQEKFAASTKEAQSALQGLKATLDSLKTAQANFGKGGERLTGDAAKAVARAAGRRTGPGGVATARSEDEIRAGAQLVSAEIEKIATEWDRANAAAIQHQNAVGRMIPGYQQLQVMEQQRLTTAERIAALSGNQGMAAAVVERQIAATQRLVELENQRAELQQSLRAKLPQKVQAKADAGDAARLAEMKALERAEVSLQKIRDIGARAAKKNATAGRGILGAVDAKNAEQMTRALKNVADMGLGGVSKEAKKAAREVANYERAVADAAKAGRIKGSADKKVGAYREGAGGIPQLAALDKAIARTQAIVREAFSTDAGERLFPGMEQDLVTLEGLQARAQQLTPEIERLTASLARRTEGSTRHVRETRQLKAAQDEYNKTMQETERLLAKNEGRLQSAATNLPQVQTPEQMRAGLIADLPPMAKTFANVFSDMQRRFIATFQFAISGALIFGTTRMIKEFVQTAIEVERAFADIESAMEFDIAAPRGTAEFNSQVESVRQQVLRLANDYNVLPTEANKSAFVMVSRFKDIDNAMQATRAQLLATKISTIDQSETLRALTAVAEGFAAAELELNDSMSLNERLMKREAMSAKLYMKALDLAVYVQQKFGVEVEDTLEGTARSTEVFRQMGFTMEQTAAIVAATSRELGQTGQQAAERLNRSLGQLTDPKIRDALLDLAAGSKDFSLSIVDFASGAQAWETITNQFQRLEKSSPTVARQILQIVGQRRELEAVAAALGTTDLQREILSGASTAAGAAENRFSFLNRTVSEMIESIKVGFQELSQNFERLGGLSMLKLFAQTFDVLLGVINEVATAAIDLKNALDKLWTIGGKGIGTWITQFAALALAVGGVVKVVQSLNVAVAALTGSKLGVALAPMLAAFGPGKHVTNAVSAAATSGATGYGLSAANPKILAAAAAGQLAAVKASTSAMVASIPVWGQVAAAVALIVFSIRKMDAEVKALAESFKAGSKIIADAGAATERRIKEEGLTGDEAELARLQDSLAAMREAQAGSSSAMPSIMSRFGALYEDIEAGTAGEISSYKDTNLWAQWERYRSPQDVEGAEEYYDAIADDIEKQIVEVGRRKLIQRARDINLPTSITEGQRQELGLPVGAVGEDARARIASLIEQSMIAGAYGDTEGASALIDAAWREYDRVLGAFGLLPGQLSTSVNTLKSKVESFDTQFQLGKMTRGDVAEGFFAASAALRVDARQGLDSEAYTEEEYKEYMRLADDWLLQGIQAKAQKVQDAIDEGAHPGEGNIERLNREIAVLGAAGADQEGRNQSEKEQHKKYIDLLEELAMAEMDLALQLADEAIAEAQSWYEWQSAKAEKNRILQKAAEQAESQGDDVKARGYESDIRVNEKADAQEAAAVAKKVAMARQRQSGPIMNSINSLKAQLIGINADLANAYTDPGDFASLMVQKNEVIAQIAQAEQAEIRAYAEAMLPVRDSIRANQLELTMLARELALMAEIFGYGTVEWSNVKKAYENMKAALMDQALELESINRLLGVDITDPYVKSQLALIDALQQQKAAELNGGDLEKARAALAVKEAEMADIAAFYSDRLFTLKFDFDRGAISKGQYIASLQKFLSEVDTSTRQGKELWQEINGLIEGMSSDLSDMQFNIPGEIRLPTLFEVRRSLTADALGVNYQDNRQQDIRIYVDSDVDVAKVANAVNEGLGSQAATASARYAPGSATLTLGV